MKIRHKLVLFIFAILTLSIIPFTLGILYWNEKVIKDKTIELCKNITHNISSAAIEELILNTTYDGTKTLIKDLEKEHIQGLENLYILNYKYDVVAFFGKSENFKDSKDQNLLQKIKSLEYKDYKIGNKKYLRFIVPIYIKYYNQDLRIGTVILDFDQEKLNEPIKNIKQQIIYISGSIFLISFIITLIMSLKFVQPIQILIKGTQEFGKGNLKFRIKLNRKDEFGELAFSFNQMAEQIEDFTENLENKVKQRTKELREALQKVNELKTQQDGDYFLTSLLVQPLIGNFQTSQNIETEFIIKQKKNFTYKKWENEIGGDYCITNNIRLGNKNYVFFVNADAMGKSIQGAGGILVLGSIINAHILQSKYGKSPFKFPELWLRNLFRDLESIFCSFEGTMYISLVMGLIDEENGFMYFANIEHPFTILYRQKRAFFLEEESIVRKLGMNEGNIYNFSIRTFLLEPEDTIFIGSDGKDDLVYKNEKGEEVINEDETLILSIIEKCEGDLNKIFEYIQSNYKIIDDISILKIHFLNPLFQFNEYIPEPIIDKVVGLKELISNKEIEKKYILDKIKKLEVYIEDHPALSLQIGNLYYLLEEYEEAYKWYYEYYYNFPYMNEILYTLSKVLYKLNRIEEAIDFGEMLYLRDPLNEANLELLCDLYIKKKVLSKAEHLLKVFESNFPHHKSLEKLNVQIQELKMLSGIQMGFDEWTLKGLEAYNQKRFKRAIYYLEKVFENNLDNVEIMLKLANSYAKLKNYERALEIYEHILTLTPNHYHVLNNIGVIYFLLNDLTKAKIYFQRALKINPLYKNAQYNLKKIEDLEEKKNEVHK
ncbi:MAG: hypothetical protein KatS3mg068_2657 [Candidatus Sericytochromatia bacterium]|nr:MAG: hypothetical protein KatS3mg068_2657 [Candidatus Sericytochromatia bacterium]GIX42085.1 MAG: hypothetical protein KatS3mg129_1818 [Leptospiraceae bacterium]